MKIKEKIFQVTDENGKYIDISKEKNIHALINGINNGVELKDLFVRHELDDDEIIGFSLLQYFKIQDGMLVDKEGNTVSLYLPDKKINLKFKKIDVKLVALDPINVSLDYVKAFSSALIPMQAPEEIFTDLSAVEKNVLTEERLAKNLEAAKAQELAKAEELAKAQELAKSEELAKAEEDSKAAAALEEAQKAAEAIRIQEEKKLKSDINPAFVYEKKDYSHIQEMFSDEGGKEYIKDQYHFFYSPVSEENTAPSPATVLIKRGADWFQEDEDGEIISENEKNVEYEFSDAQEKKKIILDMEKGVIEVLSMVNDTATHNS